MVGSGDGESDPRAASHRVGDELLGCAIDPAQHEQCMLAGDVVPFPHPGDRLYRYGVVLTTFVELGGLGPERLGDLTPTQRPRSRSRASKRAPASKSPARTPWLAPRVPRGVSAETLSIVRRYDAAVRPRSAQDAEGATDHLDQLVGGAGAKRAGRVLGERDDHVGVPLVVAGQIAQGEHARL